MKRQITPRQVAQAIDVSESSIKRWCDAGEIPTLYTAGGHRRISVPGLLEFLKTRKFKLARPELLGLPSATGRTSRVTRRAAEQLAAALLEGDWESARRIALDLALAGQPIATICDQVFAQALEQIGNRWACGEAEIYQERRGCEIAQRVLLELGQLLPGPAPRAPLALGGAIAGDTSVLPTTMAELVLKANGWNAESLGSDLPLSTMAAAVRWQQPRLVWLSCSYLADTDAFLAEYAQFYEELSPQVAVVVGGRALVESLRQQMHYAAHCDTMQHLAAFARTLHQPRSAASLS